MLVDRAKLEVVFRKVRQVQDEIKDYCLAPDRPDLPVEDFQRIVSQMYKIKIDKFSVPFEGSFVRGMLERYRDRAIIYVKKGMGEEWTRFVAVKEMCHLVNDEEEDWSVLGVSTIKEMLSEYKVARDELAAKVAQSEMLAEIGATELLYPFLYRDRDIQELNAGDITLPKISGYFKAPEVVIARALSEDYHSLASEIWGTMP